MFPPACIPCSPDSVVLFASSCFLCCRSRPALLLFDLIWFDLIWSWGGEMFPIDFLADGTCLPQMPALERKELPKFASLAEPFSSVFGRDSEMPLIHCSATPTVWRGNVSWAGKLEEFVWGFLISWASEWLKEEKYHFLLLHEAPSSNWVFVFVHVPSAMCSSGSRNYDSVGVRAR